jgi:glutathione S-transferase
MKLYYSPGACSMATHIVLNELGLAYQLERTDTANKITESGIDFRTINPKGYVPALETNDGKIVTENAAILQYVADRQPNSNLAPTNGTFERTRLQELLSYLSSELHIAYGAFFSGAQLDEDARNKAEAKIARHVQSLEDSLADGRQYLLGDNFSVADAYAFVMLNWSYPVGFDLSPWPTVLAFMKRIGSRPSVIKAMTAEGLLDEAQAS